MSLAEARRKLKVHEEKCRENRTKERVLLIMRMSRAA